MDDNPYDPPEGEAGPTPPKPIARPWGGLAILFVVLGSCCYVPVLYGGFGIVLGRVSWEIVPALLVCGLIAAMFYLVANRLPR